MYVYICLCVYIYIYTHTHKHTLIIIGNIWRMLVAVLFLVTGVGSDLGNNHWLRYQVLYNH